MNRQEVYNKVKNHLLTQMKIAVIEIEYECKIMHNCAYRTEDGLKCGIGCLILDEHFKWAFNGHAVTDADVRRALNLSGIDYVEDSSDENFLCEVQTIHDEYDPHMWESKLLELAFKHGLES